MSQTLQAIAIPEACNMLGVSTSTLYRMFDRGEIARRKIGGRTMVSLADLEVLINGKPTHANDNLQTGGF